MTTLMDQGQIQQANEGPPAGNGQQAQPVSVGNTERLVSMIGAAALIGMGLRRRSVPGLLLALAGGAMVRRGATGRWRLRSWGLGKEELSHGGGTR